MNRRHDPVVFHPMWATLLITAPLVVTGCSGGPDLGDPLGVDLAPLGEPLAPASWAPTDSLSSERTGHTATLLTDGRVLLAGGSPQGPWPGEEIYDPATGLWTPAGTAGPGEAATLLATGQVLLLGAGTCALYTPGTNTWTPLSAPHVGRSAFAMTRLQDGSVLLTGGIVPGGDGSALGSAEIYDPGSGNWSLAAPMLTPRQWHTATLLSTGS
ncbi:MAG: kelch repeat-containing protein [Byssovorax sp.]